MEFYLKTACFLVRGAGNYALLQGKGRSAHFVERSKFSFKIQVDLNRNSFSFAECVIFYLQMENSTRVWRELCGSYRILFGLMGFGFS